MSEVETHTIPKPKVGTQYLRARQRQELEGEKRMLESQMNDPGARIEDRSEVRRQLQRISYDLESQTPPELRGQALDSAVRRERELRRMIVEDMQSAEELRKNPAGAVGRLIAYEKKHKDNIVEWKNLRTMIHRDSEDPDVANLEVYRPQKNMVSMESAQIQGKDYNFPSEQFKEGYDAINWNPLSEEDVEALRREVEDLRSQVREQEVSPQSEKRGRGNPGSLTTAPCGKELDSRGLKNHMRNCKAGCQTETLSSD